jgi:hypothetical protein
MGVRPGGGGRGGEDGRYTGGVAFLNDHDDEAVIRRSGQENEAVGKPDVRRLENDKIDAGEETKKARKTK